MLSVRFEPPAAKYIKKLKDKKLKTLYREAIDKICNDYTIGEAKTGDLSGFYGYDIYYNKTNYELAYTIERVGEELVVVVMAGTRENFYDQLKRYIKGQRYKQIGQQKPLGRKFLPGGFLIPQTIKTIIPVRAAEPS